MDDPEAALKPIRELLETIRERVDYAISRLKSFEEVRSLGWQCDTCGHVKRFTRKVPSETAHPCPKCDGICFHPV
jgi:rubrerythrin